MSGESYTHTATLQNHTGPVWSLAWSHPKFGSLLASASFDGSILIHREIRPREWVLIYGQAPSLSKNAANAASASNTNANTNGDSKDDTTSTPTLHESSVNDVSFAPHEYGLILAGCSSDGKVSVLTHGVEDENDWLVEYIHDNALGVNAISWAPYMAFSSSESDEGSTALRLVTGGCDNKIRFWVKSTSSSSGSTAWTEDTTNQPISSTSATHSDWIRDVAWSPSLVPNTNIIASCSEDRTVIIWTQKGGLGKEWVGRVIHTFDDPVWKLSWNMTGSILAVSSGDSTVTLWKRDMGGDWIQVSSVEESVGASGAAANE